MALQDKLVAIEGVDGVGKTTVARIVAEALNMLYVAQPTHDGVVGKFVRSLIAPGAPDMHQTTIAALMTADAFDTLHKLSSIKDSDKDGVLFDRHALVSGPIYARSESGSSPSDALPHSIPHFTVVLDVSPDVAQARRTARGGVHDTQEAAPESEWVYRRMRYLGYVYTNPHKSVVVDASRPQDEVVADVLAAIAQFYKHRAPRAE